MSDRNNRKRNPARYSIDHGFCPACNHRLSIHDQGMGCQNGWGPGEQGCWCSLTGMSAPEKGWAR